MATAAGILDGFNFRMRQPCPAMVSSAKDLACFHDNGAHHRIGRSAPQPARRQAQG
jgi:hypothetical protein